MRAHACTHTHNAHILNLEIHIQDLKNCYFKNLNYYLNSKHW